jgi:Putative prokaryotic signal transducing protein
MTPDDAEMVPVFSSAGTTGEMEAASIHQVLEANGIPSMLIGPAALPVVGFQVQVPADRLEESRRIIAEAQAAGPSAADEAELASEGTPADQSQL